MSEEIKKEEIEEIKKEEIKEIKKEKKKFKYQNGFGKFKNNNQKGNHFISEVLEGAVPEDQNNPLKCPYGLVCEQLTGTSFTAPRKDNFRTWFYRIQPSTKQGKFKKYDLNKTIQSCFEFDDEINTPEALRWFEFEIPKKEEAEIDFVDGLHTMCGAGSASTKNGFGIHYYTINSSMKDRYFCNADGDFLFGK
jgi:homogentisate 1,2-dioxygenase